MNIKLSFSKQLISAMMLVLMAGFLAAQTPLFTFEVDDLEGTNRNTVWLFDFDSPSFATHDGNWYSFGNTPLYNAYPFLHYYAEDLVRMTQPGNSEGQTVISCVQENIPFTDDMTQISITFTPFDRTSLTQVNLVNPANPWQTHGESGDIRTYANSSGDITLGGVKKLHIINMQYEITTPYPSGQEIHDYVEHLKGAPYFYPIPFTWNTGDNIGPGTFYQQTGLGTGLVDVNHPDTDPEWAALFAPSYVVNIKMLEIVSRTTLNSTYHDFLMEISADTEPNVPVVMSSFTASVNAENQPVLNWTTASENDLMGFRVLGSTASAMNEAINLTPVLIPAQNCNCGASYSFTAWEFNTPGTYWFWLESMDMVGTSDFFGPVSVTVSDTQTPSLPDRSSLGSVYPNPFQSGTAVSIPVEVKAGDSGELSIYNLSGQRVASFPLQQGSHTISWNGLDTSGKSCASGIYFYRLSAGNHQESKKLIILK